MFEILELERDDEDTCRKLIESGDSAIIIWAARYDNLTRKEKQSCSSTIHRQSAACDWW